MVPLWLSDEVTELEVRRSDDSMSTRDTITRFGRAVGACALAGVAVTALPACRGDRSEKPPRQFFPDLDDQPKWKSQDKTQFFADGRTMRQPVPGTVAFGRVSFVNAPQMGEWAARERADFLKEDARFYDGRESDGSLVEKLPIAVTKELIERGQNRYNIYCVVCHGYQGDGKGMVGRQWSSPLPDYNDPKYKSPDKNDPKIQLWKDGHLFNIARHGLYDVTGTQKMPGYAHALNERDTWAIVAYIRTLQEARSGSLQDAPETDRAALQRQMDTMREAIRAEEARAAEEKAKADKAKADKAKAEKEKAGTPTPPAGAKQ